MSEAKARVETERDDLRTRIAALREFLQERGTLESLSPTASSLLYAQLNTMTAYASILAARLEIWVEQ